MKFKEYANGYFNTLIKVLKNVDIDQLEKLVDVLKYAYINEKKVYIMGNGGSASTASHWACDFSKGTVYEDKKRFKFISLNDNIAHFTAIANDISYDDVFVEQLKNILTKDDVVMIISASGNSKNTIKALEYGNSIGSKTVAMVGFTGGQAKDLADIFIHIENMEYGPVEDVHMILDHLLSGYFRENIIKNIG